MLWIADRYSAAGHGTALWDWPTAPRVSAQQGTRIRTAVAEDTAIAVVGSCHASDAEVHEGITAVRARQWQRLTHWPGSYWVIAWHQGTTTVLTDLCGSRPVYYTSHPHGCAWSSSARLLAASHQRALDDTALSALLTCPTVPEIVAERTTFREVYRVPGGHLLHVTPTGSVVRPYEPPPPHTDSGVAAPRLRHALLRAVLARVRNTTGPISTDLSGGLDSSSIALLTAQATRAPLLALTRTTGAEDEDQRYAIACAEEFPNLHHRVVHDERHALFTQLDRVPPTDQLFSDAPRWGTHTSYHQMIRAHGSTLHLSGSGGDTLLASVPFALADLTAPPQWRSLLQHARDYADTRHQATASVLSRSFALARTSPSQALRSFASSVENPDGTWRRPRPKDRLTWFPPPSFAAWLTKDAQKELAQRAHAAAQAAARDSASQPSSRDRAWAELHEYGTHHAERRAQFSAVGVYLDSPFLDNEVIRACMSLPVAQRYSTHRQKPLLGSALEGLVPRYVLERPTKGSHDTAAYTSIHANAATLRQIVHESRLADRGVIDRNAVRDDLERLIAGAPGRLALFESFLAAELWLAHNERPVAAHGGSDF
ncbi:asparagine synthase (glutamine-hydrolysing) [Haloactinospora alba]|uniref:asparagine synthase (glutamine-hydrolyzing) n=1 Tax=Haloactinospora alba TaxID=405555 RepID=A0A543NM90_9ACTN|nr:albusnodin/ikarugamycin family macrolactam cyclase [Haloactinospora alba]TQN32914.1 asparagine synthase (glutamine-hydrolysing) [Haloactinospora alba]